MNINIFLPQIIHDLWRHKLRSGLAIFCIAFGVFAVVMLTAFGESFYERNATQMMDIASDTFFVWMGKSSQSASGYPKGQMNPITSSMLMELPKILPQVKWVSPEMNRKATLNYNGKRYDKSVYGVSSDYSFLAKIKLVAVSRFINHADIAQTANVVVISSEIKEIFFGKEDALHKKILVNDVPFTVVGVVAKDKSHNYNNDRNLFISYKSYEKIFGDDRVYFFMIAPNFGTDFIQFEKLLRGHFADKCHFNKNDPGPLNFWGTSKVYKFFHWFFLTLKIFLSACGLMILSVGSVGVANIMFLIVTERTYEIGLQKVLGATDRQILLQLFFEAVFMIGLGGILGISLAVLAITILPYTNLPQWLTALRLSGSTLSITLVILALVALIAGFFPANRAAKMDPMEALLMQ